MIDRWLALVTRVSTPPLPDVARAIFGDLATRYSAPDRRYHTLAHIDACLHLLDHVRTMAEHPDSIELATWFHDAIYDSHRSDNEEASARLAVDALARLGLSRAITQAVHDMILATRHNTPPANPDTALLIDIDLSILGQPATVFDEYEAGIRFEYAWVSDPDFRVGRSKVLQSFLDRPRIYSTSFFEASFETTARQNIARSLANLAR